MTTDQPIDAGASTSSARTPGGDIVARAGRYYRNMRYLMFVGLLAMAGWFLYDGFVKYPRENATIARLTEEQREATKRNDTEEVGRIAEELKNYQHHNDASLLLQRGLGFGLPFVAFAVLAWALHRSRGEYRLSGTKLSTPGHPMIDLDDIKSVNNDLWDRKGIVYLTYETKDGQSGEMSLDDFVYDRPPTDAIYDRIAEKFGLNEDEETDEDDDEDEEEADDDPADDPANR